MEQFIVENCAAPMFRVAALMTGITEKINRLYEVNQIIILFPNLNENVFIMKQMFFFQ
jgi:hypothetical protein